MERLTQWLGNGTVRVAALAEEHEEKHPTNELVDLLLDKLAAYEDTGLTPEEVNYTKLYAMGKAVAEITEFDGVPIDRLKELALADKEGLVAIRKWRAIWRWLVRMAKP